MKKPYTMAQLQEVARKAGVELRFVEGQYKIRHVETNANFITDSRQEVWRILHSLIPVKETTTPNIKVVVMTEDGRVIDEFQQVRVNHGSLEEMQRYNATLVRWIMRTAAAGEVMQVDKSIGRMPKVKTPKKVWELRKELYHATHKPWALADCPTLWAKIEQLLIIAESRDGR